MVPEDAVAAAEKEIADALKPLEPPKRPLVSLVGPPTSEPMNTVLPPSKGQETAPQLSVSERLGLLEYQNTEIRQVMGERFAVMEEELQGTEARLVLQFEALIRQVLAKLG